MAQKPMYPAMSGSPNTTTTAAIGVSDTEITVAELSVLPAAPNICMIYVSSTKWERCLYSAKSNASGAGTITVARSGDGHASTDGSNGPLEFDSGAKVMRNFTAYDHDLVKYNIEDLETRKITSTGVTFENLNTNGDIGTGADQVSPGNHTHPYQPSDATLTAIAGLTTAANKLPYATGVGTFSTCDFTSLGRSLIGTTTASAVRDLIAATSGTTATQSIYVDSAATGGGTGVDWANAFTSWTAAVNSLPAIINHAVTIYGRNGTYAENVTIKRVVAAGSITLRGEYYWYGTNAGTKTGKLDLGSSDFGYADRAQISSGDVVWATKWSGSVGASTPSASIVDTVASVSDAEITLTTNTAQAFDATWTYQIVKTKISPASGSGLYINSTNSVTVNGIGISTGATGWSYPVRVSDGGATFNYCYLSAVNNVVAGVSLSTMSNCTFTKCAVIVDACASTPVRLESKSMVTFLNSIISAHAASVGAFAMIEDSYGFVYRSHIMDAPVGLYAHSGGIVRYSVTLNEATTPMNPATSPGNYNGYIGMW